MIVRPSVVLVNPLDDVQAAINAVSTGGIVQLGPGTYTVTTSLVLYDNVTLQGQGRATVINMTGSAFSILNISGLTGVTVRAIRFTGSTASGYLAGRGAIWAGSAATNCLIEGNFVEGVYSSGIVGVFVRSRIAYNHIASTMEHGIYLSSATGTTVVGNTLMNTGSIGSGNQNGVKMSACSECVVSGNTITAPEHEGIDFDVNTANCIAVGNVVSSCPQRAIRFVSTTGNNNSAIGNYCLNSTFEGIAVQGGVGTLVEGNYVNGSTSNGSAGIYIGAGSTGAVIVGNHVVGLTGAGLLAYVDDGLGTSISSPDNVAPNNTVSYEDDYVMYEDAIVTY